MSESSFHSASSGWIKTEELDPKPSLSSSTTTTSSSSAADRWARHPYSLQAAKRQQTQTERMRQLQDLEQQIADASNWNKRRIATTTSQRSSNGNEYNWQRRSPSRNSFEDVGEVANRRSPAERTIDDIDLRDASLEDLEGLIAASAQRLANYRLQKTSDYAHRRIDSNSSSSSVYSSNRISRDSSTHRISDLLRDGDDDQINGIKPISTVSSASTWDSNRRKEKVAIPSTSYSSIRAKFENASNNYNNNSSLIMQFDPLLSSPKSSRSSAMDLLSDSNIEDGSSTTAASHSLLTPSQSSLKNAAEAKERKKHLKVKVDHGSELGGHSPSLLNSPRTPTRLQTPKYGAANNTLPRSSLPAPQVSSSRRLRTFSTAETPKWLDTIEKARTKDLDIQATRSTTKNTDLKRVQTLGSIKMQSTSSSSSRRSLPSRRSSPPEELTRSPQIKSKGSYLVREGVEHVPSRSTRTRTVSMVTTPTTTSTRTSMTALRSSKAAATTSKDHVKSKGHMLDEDNDADVAVKDSYPALRARVVSMTTSSSSSGSNSKTYELPSASATRRRAAQQAQRVSQPAKAKPISNSSNQDTDSKDTGTSHERIRRKRGKVNIHKNK